MKKNNRYINIPENNDFYRLTKESVDNEKLRKKLGNAIDSYFDINTKKKDEVALFLFDDTVFGSAKDGFIITTKSIYFKPSFEDADQINLSNTSYATSSEKTRLQLVRKL